MKKVLMLTAFLFIAVNIFGAQKTPTPVYYFMEFTAPVKVSVANVKNPNVADEITAYTIRANFYYHANSVTVKCEIPGKYYTFVVANIEKYSNLKIIKAVPIPTPTKTPVLVPTPTPTRTPQ